MKTSFEEWLQQTRPGVVRQTDSCVEIAHDRRDEVSTLWLNQGLPAPACLGEVAEFYARFDGADLFDSTFKIASIAECKKSGGVELTFTLAELREECEAIGIVFPDDAFPFMYEAGMGYYAASTNDSVIHFWDVETGNRKGFPSLRAIVQQWLDAVDDDAA